MHITIGELCVETEILEHGEVYVTINAAEVRREDAPAFGEPTDHSNSRWPGYGQWSDFLEFVGLRDLFFDEETGLMRKHPGAVRLSEEHRQAINEAYAAFYAKYPTAVAGYSPVIATDIFAQDPSWPKENSMAVRMEWLKYWVNWAMDNCAVPVISNH